jgi:3-dehydroquinate synthase
MNEIKVKSQRGAYEILIGKALLEKTGALLKETGLTGKAMIVVQQPAAALYLKKVTASLQAKKIEVHTHTIADGEAAKSEGELFRIFRALCDKDFERRDTLIALGGGVTGDLTGFAAASYMRGVPFVNIPTTLLAQVDSSIGGKTGINLREGKNLVGAFYPPKLVISDVSTLKTLPERELHASLAEVVKYGVIRDAKLFRFLETHADSILSKDPAALEKIVIASAAIKAGVVSRDEHETKGERMILNFGHTFGHGFEQALYYSKLLHGEAVSIGMVSAAQLAVHLKLFPKAQLERLTAVLHRLRLPVSLSGLDVDLESVLSAMNRDKKKKSGKLRFVLPVEIGKVIIRDDIPLGMVQDILGAQGAK